MRELYKPSSLKLHLRAELPFKAKELALKTQSCQNLDIVKVRTNLANCLLGLVSSCPQWHRAGCSDILNTIPYGPLTLGWSLRRRLVWIQPLIVWIWKLIFFLFNKGAFSFGKGKLDCNQAEQHMLCTVQALYDVWTCPTQSPVPELASEGGPGSSRNCSSLAAEARGYPPLHAAWARNSVPKWDLLNTHQGGSLARILEMEL